MGSQFRGRGRLGDQPKLRYVTVSGESRAVADMRIYFSRMIPRGEGVFEDRGGHWKSVTLWGQRAEHAVRLLCKGMAVVVEGDLILETWADKETGEERKDLVVSADHIDIDLMGVESVVMRRKAKTPGGLPGDDAMLLDPATAPVSSRSYDPVLENRFENVVEKVLATADVN